MYNAQYSTVADQLVIARNQMKALRAKVQMARAMAKSANVTRKFGETDAHKKNLTLLKRFRHVIGEDVHKAHVQE
jgi:hypothetical protein